jgi:predicted metal-dependent hydrolase
MTENIYFVIGDKKIFYTIKRRARQRQINLIVHQDGTLVVTAPKSCTQKSISKEIKKNKKWIAKHISGKIQCITVDPCVVNHMKKLLKPIIEAKLLQFNSYYNFEYNRISIRHQKTRWGSCSSEGNLNFNCKLMCLSNELKEYVVAHELCHLREMNHSKDFWALVEKTVPNYNELMTQLKNINI